MIARQPSQILNYTALMQKSIEQTLARQTSFINAFGEQVSAPDGLNFEGLMRGDYHATDGSQINIEQYAWMLTNARPHLWANMNLIEPDTMMPYEFWDYQLASVNYRMGDVIHKDGAEVGKTREIITLLMWSCATLHNLELLDVHGNPMRRVQSLVGAPLQGHLTDIIDAIEEQIELSPQLQAMCNKGWHKKAPYHKMTFTHGDGRGIIDFRPAGIAGASFRGVHVNGWGLLDEATLLKNKKHYSEFKRGLKPTAQWREYSVSDGDRDCEFHRRGNEALPYPELQKQLKQGRLTKGEFPRVLFNWPKTLMPAPFWSAARRRQYIKDFGGEDSSGYQQNVLGRDGDRSNAVFPFATLKPVLADIQEFRCLKMIANKSESTFSIELLSYEAIGVGEGREVIEFERVESIRDWNNVDEWHDVADSIVLEAFGHIRGGSHWIGCDLGFSMDPTEILVAEDRLGTLRRHSRLHMKGVDYHIQTEFIRAIDSLFDPDAITPNIGVDQGSAGVAVIGQLCSEERYQHRNYEERLLGIQFGGGFDSVDLEGEVVIDRQSEKPMRVNGKELGSDLLSLAMQKKKAQYPLAPEIVQTYTSQVYTQGPRWRSFKNKNDHLVDADRALIMNKVLADGVGGHDAFSCGAHQR